VYRSLGSSGDAPTEAQRRYLGRAGSGCYWEALRPEVIRLLTENQPVD